MKTAVVLFTRDLRLADNPALAAAERAADRVVRLFVRDPSFPAPPRRLAFLGRLVAAIPELVVAEGDYVDEVARLRPDAVFCSEDASPYARRRERRLGERFDLRLFAGTTVVPFDELKTYRVFTPYFRVWSQVPLRPVEAGRAGSETEAQAELAGFLGSTAEKGSHLSPYLHFGALSALQCVVRGAHKPEFVRQLAWRDFYLQLLRAEPARFALGSPAPAGDAFAAWREGRTGYALVDAGMRQLREEGWMPNRVRMVCASFLVHNLRLDWRVGAAHFEELLVDGDVAANRGNWLWIVANTRRVFNPELQAKRMPEYVERWAPTGRPALPESATLF